MTAGSAAGFVGGSRVAVKGVDGRGDAVGHNLEIVENRIGLEARERGPWSARQMHQLEMAAARGCTGGRGSTGAPSEGGGGTGRSRYEVGGVQQTGLKKA